MRPEGPGAWWASWSIIHVSIDFAWISLIFSLKWSLSQIATAWRLVGIFGFRRSHTRNFLFLTLANIIFRPRGHPQCKVPGLTCRNWPELFFCPTMSIAPKTSLSGCAQRQLKNCRIKDFKRFPNRTVLSLERVVNILKSSNLFLH